MIVNRKDPKFRALLQIVESVEKYRKHDIVVQHYDTVELHDTYWDGGSRSSYALVAHVTTRPSCIRRYPHYAPSQFGGPKESPRIELKTPGFAIVTTGMFCGKTATATVTLSAADFEALE